MITQLQKDEIREMIRNVGTKNVDNLCSAIEGLVEVTERRRAGMQPTSPYFSLDSGEISLLISSIDAIELQRKVRSHVDSIVSTLLPDYRTMLSCATWGTNFDPAQSLRARLVLEGDRLRKEEPVMSMDQKFCQTLK